MPIASAVRSVVGVVVEERIEQAEAAGKEVAMAEVVEMMAPEVVMKAASGEVVKTSAMKAMVAKMVAAAGKMMEAVMKAPAMVPAVKTSAVEAVAATMAAMTTMAARQRRRDRHPCGQHRSGQSRDEFVCDDHINLHFHREAVAIVPIERQRPRHLRRDKPQTCGCVVAHTASSPRARS